MSNIPWYLDALKQGIEVAENMNIHPDLKQAAIDQGIRPAGYYDPNTGWSRLSTDKLFDLHKGIYDRAVKDTVDRVLELIDELNDTKALAKATPPGSYLHKTYARRLKGAVKELAGEGTEGND